MSLLKQKIEQVKQELGYKYLSYMSIDLGYAHNYLGRVLSKGLEAKAEAKLIAKLDEFLELHKKELTHDFQGKALNTQVDDAMMIPKTEYSEMYSKNTALCFKVGTLEKENAELKNVIEHKDQVLDKRNDLYSSLEMQLEDKNFEIKKIERNYDVLLDSNKNLNEKMLLAEQDSEKWQCDYWTVSRENVELINSKRTISIWLSVSILIIVLMVAFGILHFNGVV